jgi:hypothetical protein
MLILPQRLAAIEDPISIYAKDKVVTPLQGYFKYQAIVANSNGVTAKV